MSSRSRACSPFAPTQFVSSWSDPKWRPRPAPRLAACLLTGLVLSLHSAAAEITAAAPAAVAPGERMVLSTGTTVTGEPIRYPSGGPAKITAMEITLQPGQQTGWHTHPVPLFGYMLEGELTVDYGTKGKRIYRKGDGLAEAMNEAHNGRNTGRKPLRILAVFIGQEGEPGTVPASPPAH
jgi:quercetin dioxygenase-like cupin family protein